MLHSVPEFISGCLDITSSSPPSPQYRTEVLLNQSASYLGTTFRRREMQAIAWRRRETATRSSDLKLTFQESAQATPARPPAYHPPSTQNLLSPSVQLRPIAFTRYRASSLYSLPYTYAFDTPLRTALDAHYSCPRWISPTSCKCLSGLESLILHSADGSTYVDAG